MGQLGEHGVVGDDDRRVGDGLRIEDPCRRGREGSLDRGVIGDVDEFGRHPEPAKDPGHLGSRSPVRRRRGDDPVARRYERHERRVDRGHARRQRDAVLGPLELGNRASQGGGRWVVDAAIRVARALAC
jgi:hypothetical protein